MANPPLGRGLDRLMGGGKSSSPPPEKVRAPSGLHVLIRGADAPPATSSGASRKNEESAGSATGERRRSFGAVCGLFAADGALVLWALGYVWTHDARLSVGAWLACVSSVVIAAVLGLIAVGQLDRN